MLADIIPPAPPPPLEAKLSLRLLPATLAQLQRLSATYGASPSKIVRHLVESALAADVGAAQPDAAPCDEPPTVRGLPGVTERKDRPEALAGADRTNTRREP